MQMLNYEIVNNLELSLKKILPQSLNNFACYVQDGNSLIILFMPISMPSPEELAFLATELTDCIDSILPVKKGIPTWTASVKIGAKSPYGSGDLGKTVFTFWGKTLSTKGDYWPPSLIGNDCE